jgi:hypothetical protein
MKDMVALRNCRMNHGYPKSACILGIGRMRKGDEGIRRARRAKGRKEGGTRRMTSRRGGGTYASGDIHFIS